MTPQEDNVEMTRRVNEELRKYHEAQLAAIKSTEDSTKADEKFAQGAMVVVQQLEKLYNAQLKYELSMAKGAKGSAQFNDSIDAMTETVQVAAVALSLLVPGGPLIKAVTAGLTLVATTAMKTAAEMQKAANEQADATYKAFQEFSKAGATGADGLKGFFDDVNRMRLNVNQLDAMAGVIANSAKEMTAMGGTVYRGRKQFANLVEGLGTFEKGMLNLGMSYDDQAEAVLGYMKVQSNITRGQQQDYGKLTKAARQYIEETEVMTRITGLNRKQQEEVLDRQMSSQRSGARLQELADENNMQAVKLLQQQVKIYAKMGPQAEQGYNDILSGHVNTVAAQKLMTATQGKVMQDQNDIIEGRITSEREAMTATQETAKVMGEMQKDMRGLFKAGVGEEIMLPFVEMTNANKIAAGNLTESVDDARGQVDKLTGTVGGADKQLSSYTDLIKNQNDQMLALQKSLNGAFSAAGVGVQGFTDILGKTGEIIMDLGRKALEMMGLMNSTNPSSSGARTAKSEMGGEADIYGGDSTAGVSTAPAVPHPTDETGRKLSVMEIAKLSSQRAKENNARRAGVPAPAAPPAAPAPAAPTSMANTSTSPAKAPSSPQAQQANVTSYSDRLLNYIKTTERFTAKAFWDKKQYTNGYGTKALSPDEVITEAEANTRLHNYLQNAVTGVISYGKSKKYSWTQGQIDALTSFAYNGGIGMLDKLTQGGKRTNDEIAQSMMLYNKAIDSKTGEAEILPGLTKRRQEELAMFQAANGGIFDGPKSGYAATLHGHEAVIPLKDGAVPVSMSQEFNMTAANLGELVTILKSNTGMQDRMLAVLEDIRRSQSSVADHTGRMAAVASN